MSFVWNTVIVETKAVIQLDKADIAQALTYLAFDLPTGLLINFGAADTASQFSSPFNPFNPGSNLFSTLTPNTRSVISHLC